jgi:gamma-glutamylcyclotransferase (GGCT)/AIG2-like uncharacterized protein YtfP
MNKKTKIFVYGSLLSGLYNHAYLRDQEFLGLAETKPCYTLLSLNSFPGLHEGGCTSVKGEVYEIDETTLRGIDTLEGIDEDVPGLGLYRRELIELQGDIKVLGYIYNGRENKNIRIKSGDWKQHLDQEKPYLKIKREA